MSECSCCSSPPTAHTDTVCVAPHSNSAMGVFGGDVDSKIVGAENRSVVEEAEACGKACCSSTVDGESTCDSCCGVANDDVEVCENDCCEKDRDDIKEDGEIFKPHMSDLGATQ
ncbi:hypothetical protein B0H12DRAFT_199768 [Mycena haematopus]|nr:hypothetical protein B0H12DRAFT_199768 [Mycena haematopus]